MAMAPLVVHSTSGSRAAGATTYGPAATCGAFAASVEADTEVAYRTAGALSNLAVYISANDRGASTVRTRKNGANGNQSVSIGASTTGFFEDTSNTDTLAVGDKACTQFVAGSGGTIMTCLAQELHFTPTATGLSSVRACAVPPSALSTASTTTYCALGAVSNWNATESTVQLPVEAACTAKHLYVRVSANARTTTTTIGVRKNAANGNLAVSVGSSATGTFEDTSNTDSLAADDLVNGYATTGTGTGSLTVASYFVSFETADETWTTCAVAGAAQVFNNNTTTYAALSGPPGGFATEATRTTRLRIASYLSRLWVNITANSLVLSASITVTVRVAAADTSLAVSASAGQTGNFSDTTHSVAVTAGQDVCYKVGLSGATGSVSILKIALKGAANRTLSPTGVASTAAVGSPTVLRGAVTVSPTAIASAAAVGSPTVLRGAVTVQPTGISSTRTVGSPTVLRGAVTVSPTGVSSSAAVGSPTVTSTANVVPAGIASSAAAGSPTVMRGAVIVTPAGVSSSAAVGAPTVSPGGVTVSPSGVPSISAVGTPTVTAVTYIVAPNGVASSAAVGAPTVTASASIEPAGVPSTSAVGEPTLTTIAYVTPDGVSSGAAVGEPTVTSIAYVAPDGVASTATPGTPTIAFRVFVTPAGVPSTAAVGAPTVLPGEATIAPAGVASSVAFGAPTVTALTYVFPAGVAGNAAAGVPTVAAVNRVFPAGVASNAAVGSPSVALIAYIRPSGIASPGAVGQPTLVRGRLLDIRRPHVALASSARGASITGRGQRVNVTSGNAAQHVEPTP